MADQVHPRLHARLDRRQQGLAKVPQHVPHAPVDQCEDTLANMRIIAKRDIEIGHQSFERCTDIAVLDIQLSQPDARLGRLQSAVDVPLLRQQLLLLRQLRLRVLNRGFERPGLADRLLILVGADKTATEERFQSAGMGASIRRVRLQPGYFRAPRCDRLLDAADLA
jgi:hypothetical protein